MPKARPVPLGFQAGRVFCWSGPFQEPTSKSRLSPSSISLDSSKVVPLTLVSSVPFCRRERSKVPYIVRQCLEEIERRGLEEVGIYRVSGVATDIQALKTAFDSSQSNTSTNPLQCSAKSHYQVNLFMCVCLCACADHQDVSVMMSEMDVNAIAGTLKLYFRELPEPLFTDELYPNFTGGISE